MHDHTNALWSARASCALHQCQTTTDIRYYTLQADAHHSFEPLNNHHLGGVVGGVGNNDLLKDYFLNVSGVTRINSSFANKWLLGIEPSIGAQLSGHEQRTFVKGGYFSREVCLCMRAHE